MYKTKINNKEYKMSRRKTNKKITLEDILKNLAYIGTILWMFTQTFEKVIDIIQKLS